MVQRMLYNNNPCQQNQGKDRVTNAAECICKGILASWQS